MDDRGEAASCQDLASEAEEDSSDLDYLDATLVLDKTLPTDTDKQLLESVVVSDDTTPEDHLEDTLDATVVADIEAFDYTDHSNRVSALDWVDRAEVFGENSPVLLTGVGVTAASNSGKATTDAASHFLDAFDGDAPAPPPVCSEGEIASSPMTLKGPNKPPVWIEKPIRPKRRFFTRALVVVGLVALVGASFYGFRQYQSDGLFSEIASTNSPEEVVPPEGVGLMLQASEVQYCLSQGVRLGSAAEHAASLGAAALARLPDLFADYDKRCKSYQFAPGAVIAAEVVLEAQRAELQQQGILLLVPDMSDTELKEVLTAKAAISESAEGGFVAESAVEVEVAKPADTVVVQVNEAEDSRAEVVLLNPDLASVEPRTIVKDMQWRLFKLDLYNATIDGVYDENTQLSIDEFFRMYSELPRARGEAEIFNAIDSVYAKLN